VIEPRTEAWRFVGSTANTRYFDVEPGILAAVPHPDAGDDRITARENLAFQERYFVERGRAGVVVIFFDRMIAQDQDARRVYQREPDAVRVIGRALVGAGLLARAMMSFFVGIARPRGAVKAFATTDDALAWARAVLDRAAVP